MADGSRAAKPARRTIGSSPIPLFKVFMAPEDALMPRLRDTLYGGYIAEGEVVEQFEKSFARFVGAPAIAACSSCTAGLHLALILAGVGPGDEVITTAMTAEPSNMAIRHAGGRIVWADVDPRNGNIDPASVAEAITPRTRAILVVHYGGVPVDLDALRAVADSHGIPVVEDAAHALGARYAGRPIGGHSAFVAFSFQAIKHMTTVDGGMLAIADPGQVPRARRLRWFGLDRDRSRTAADIDEVGYKYNMNNVTATIGAVQLAHIGPCIDRHMDNGRYFDEALAGIPGLDRCTYPEAAEPSYWFYTVLADRRDDLARKLFEAGIGCSQAHQRNDRHTIFADSQRPLPGLDRFYDRMLHIPCGWWVSDDDRHSIVETIRSGW